MPSPKAKRPHATPLYQLVSVDDMTAGLDLRRTPTQLASDRARLLMNWSVSESGALAVRDGHQQYSTASLGSKRITGARRVYLSSHTFTLAGFDGQVHDLASTGWSTVYSSISSGSETYFPYDRDMVAVFDGVNQMQKSTNGSSWTQFGIDRPSVASSVAVDTSTGTLLAAKEYEFNYTFESAFPHESNGSSNPTTVTTGASTGGAVIVEFTGSTDPQVTAINIYGRNVTDGETIRRKASSAANPAGSTGRVLISSSDWLQSAEEPSDHNVPEVLAIGVVWKNRWWAKDATVKNRLYFTQVFQSQSWPTTFFIDIPFPSGDGIEALIPLGDTLLVFGGTDIYIIFGQTSLDFEVRPAIDAQDGALGPRAVAVIENGVVHAGASGVYIFDGVSDRLLSYDIEPGWRDLVEAAAVADIAKVAVVYFAREKKVRIAVPRLYPTANPGEWVLDLNRTRVDEIPAWEQTDRAIGGYIHWDGAETDVGTRGRLQSWSDTAGIVFTESTGTSDNSSNIVAEYAGSVFASSPHRVRVIDTFGEYEPNDGTFAIETVVNELSKGSITVSIGEGLAKYGTAVYGTASYGGAGRKRYHRMLPASAEGRTFQRKMVYTGQAKFKTYTYGYGVVPEPAPLDFSD